MQKRFLSFRGTDQGWVGWLEVMYVGLDLSYDVKFIESSLDSRKK